MCYLLWLCLLELIVFFFFSLHLAPVSSQTSEEAQTAPADPASPNISKSFTLGNAGDTRVSTPCPSATLRVPSKGLWILCSCSVHVWSPSTYTCVSRCTHVQFALLYKWCMFSIKSHTHPYTQVLDCCWLIPPLDIIRGECMTEEWAYVTESTETLVHHAKT